MQPTITISSMSELTGVVDSVSVSEKTRKDDYIVVAPDHGGTASAGQQSSTGSGSELKLSLHGEEHSMSPVASPPPLSLSVPFVPLSPNIQNTSSFTVVNDREIIKTLPVAGLSSAADAAQDLESENGKDVKTNEEARALFEMEHMSHFNAIMIQLIKSYGMSLSWLKVIKPLIMEAARKVKTNVYQSDIMDIKAYVKVKKIPGGQREDSTLVNGVVCTKNITHKKMKISIRNPSILLLKCAFEFQRKENQLSSFDTLQMQEEKYLKNLVARVKTFQPRVILVQKSVARLALEMFYHLDIAVAVNVKPSVMERVARSTQGDLLHSLDQLFFNVQLGVCGQFHLRNFVLPDGVKKTLMYFDHCDPRLGCAITLMGGSRRELKKVKKVTLFGIYVAYNSQLESSFLIDEFAWPAPSVPQLLPDIDGYSSSPTTPEWPLHPSVSYPIEGIAPSVLARKLEALVPELKLDFELNESSSRSTPTMQGSSISNRNSNTSTSPQTSSARSHLTSEYKSEQSIPNLVVTQDEGNGKRLPIVSRSIEDIKFQSDTFSHRTQDTSPGADVATLSHLGEREFERVLSSQILSITPGINFPVPYLQSPEGFDADIRKYLPSVIYWSYQFLTHAKVGSTSPTKSGGKKSSTGSLVPSTHTSELEMGIKRSALGDYVDGNRSPVPPLPDTSKCESQWNKSYRSISEHPFTTSVFLLKANTNEMRAALADYRANSGLANPSQMFFFPTASQASDYRMHLQNIFNKYRQFEVSDQSDEVSEDNDERNDSRERKGIDRARTRSAGSESGRSLVGSGEGGLAAERRVRQRAKRHATPSLCGSGRKDGVVGGRGAIEGRVLAKSCDTLDGVEGEATDPAGRERQNIPSTEKQRGTNVRVHVQIHMYIHIHVHVLSYLGGLVVRALVM